MPAAARLPGIQFEVAAPPAAEALVRMDIASFVGFAASGPLHLPVAVEDIARFEEIFGDDLVIASETGSSQPVYAYLPSAVRAFFRNGGQRCWVIRVAELEGATPNPLAATANRFPIPGLYELQGNATVQAYAKARSEGSWFDSVIVGTALRSHSAEVTSFTADPLTIGLTVSSHDEIAPGDLLKLTFGVGGDVLWLFPDSVRQQTASPPFSSLRGRPVTASGSVAFWQFSSPPQAADVLPACEKITMDVFAQRDSQSWSLTDLGFAPSHPRYWAALPDDTTLFATDKREGLAAEADHPRFPLAGLNNKGFYLPLEIGPLPLKFNRPEATTKDAIVRNGLSVFGSSLFLDPALADSSSNDLLKEADYIRYQSSSPRRLTGIHAALAIEEATIIAVPDAVHRGWSSLSSLPLPSPPESSPVQHPEWWHFLDCQEKQDIPLVPEPPLGQFEPCNLLIIAPPVLTLAEVTDGRIHLTWTPLAGATDFLEEALDDEFRTARVIYQGSSGDFTIYSRPADDYYYRLRRQIGSVSSDYSNGIGVRIGGPAGWQLYPVSVYNDAPLLDIHTALVHMSTSRGDLFAVLAMPEHYRENQAAAHAAQLRSRIEGEDLTPSFGALYYPWLAGREEDDLLSIRTTPPDGAAAGIMAKRSATRGPWVSPANEPLRGVVDLSPAVSRLYRQALQDSLINLTRQEPGGFLCLSAVTLSDDPDLSPINVRRLLSFLRKTALRAGVNYVFEPNSNEFRRSVQRGFEDLLDGLMLRGAFAGRTSREAFQVVTDSTVNTPQAMEWGEFIVELRVAPSLPMRFLNIRLLQTADRTSVTEGR